jgi:tetratricopeptide (TPR) repeat protein
VLIEGLLLAVLAAIAFYPVLDAGFLWDDKYSIQENPILRDWPGLVKIWLEPSEIRNEGHYWPVVYTSLWLDYQLWGGSSFGFHLQNLLHYLATIVLLRWLFFRMGIPGAFWVAALFALHPLHVESVAWTIERKDTLCGLFYAAGMLAWVRYDEKNSYDRYAWVLVFFLLAMLSKSLAVSFPIAVFLYQWWKHGRCSMRDIMALTPLVILTLVITMLDVQFSRRMEPIVFDLSAMERILIAGRALWFYAFKLIWPYPLMAIYPRWETAGAPAWQYLFPLAALAVPAALWYFRGRLGRGPLAVVLFFYAAVAPALGLVDYGFMRFSFVADRFQYIGGIGILILAGSGAVLLARRFARPGWIALYAAGVVVLALLGFQSFQHSRYYESQETLFKHNVKVNPASWMAWNNVGAEMAYQDRYEEAVPYYIKALELRPDYEIARNNLGVAYLNTGRPGKALPHSLKAVELKPNASSFHFNLGNVYWDLEQFENAAEHYRRAVELNPGYLVARQQLALTLARLNRPREAADEFEQVARMNGLDPVTAYNYARVLQQLDQKEKAVELLRIAEKMAPENPIVISELAWMLSTNEKLRDGREAVRLAEKAVQPPRDKDPFYLDILAAAYAAAGEYEKAVDITDEALEILLKENRLMLYQKIQSRQRVYKQNRPLTIQ